MPLKTKPSHHTTVPASALRFDAALEFVSDAPREDPNRVPIRILARSGDAIEHPYWGKIIHDLSGMKLRKPRLQLDWCHWEWESIGYADGFEIETGDLIVTGELVSTHEGDQASIIIAKGQAGIPYEASIDFNGPGLRLEELGPDTSAVVNGRTVEGPAVIVREWPLRSVALCPYGADHNSQSEFSESPDGEITVAIFTFKESKMNKKLAAALNAAMKMLSSGKGKTPNKRQLTSQLAKAAGITVKEMSAILAGGGSAVSQAVAAKRLAAWAKVLKAPIATFKAAAQADEKARKLADETKEQEDEEELEDEEEMEDEEELEDEEEMEDEEKEQSSKSKKGKSLSADRKELQRFIKAFGANAGARWFAAGKSFAQAQILHNKRLEKQLKSQMHENKKLRRKLAAADNGEEVPIPFNDGNGSKDSKALAQYETKIGTNLARFAAGVKLPGKK